MRRILSFSQIWALLNLFRHRVAQETSSESERLLDEACDAVSARLMEYVEDFKNEKVAEFTTLLSDPNISDPDRRINIERDKKRVSMIRPYSVDSSKVLGALESYQSRYKSLNEPSYVCERWKDSLIGLDHTELKAKFLGKLDISFILQTISDEFGLILNEQKAHERSLGIQEPNEMPSIKVTIKDELFASLIINALKCRDFPLLDRKNDAEATNAAKFMAAFSKQQTNNVRNEEDRLEIVQSAAEKFLEYVSPGGGLDDSTIGSYRVIANVFNKILSNQITTYFRRENMPKSYGSDYEAYQDLTFKKINGQHLTKKEQEKLDSVTRKILREEQKKYQQEGMSAEEAAERAQLYLEDIRPMARPTSGGRRTVPSEILTDEEEGAIDFGDYKALSDYQAIQGTDYDSVMEILKTKVTALKNAVLGKKYVVEGINVPDAIPETIWELIMDDNAGSWSTNLRSNINFGKNVRAIVYNPIADEVNEAIDEAKKEVDTDKTLPRNVRDRGIVQQHLRSQKDKVDALKAEKKEFHEFFGRYYTQYLCDLKDQMISVMTDFMNSNLSREEFEKVVTALEDVKSRDDELKKRLLNRGDLLDRTVSSLEANIESKLKIDENSSEARKDAEKVLALKEYNLYGVLSGYRNLTSAESSREAQLKREIEEKYGMSNPPSGGDYKYNDLTLNLIPYPGNPSFKLKDIVRLTEWLSWAKRLSKYAQGDDYSRDPKEQMYYDAVPIIEKNLKDAGLRDMVMFSVSPSAPVGEAGLRLRSLTDAYRTKVFTDTSDIKEETSKLEEIDAKRSELTKKITDLRKKLTGKKSRETLTTYQAQVLSNQLEDAKFELRSLDREYEGKPSNIPASVKILLKEPPRQDVSRPIEQSDIDQAEDFLKKNKYTKSMIENLKIKAGFPIAKSKLDPNKKLPRLIEALTPQAAQHILNLPKTKDAAEYLGLKIASRTSSMFWSEFSL